jgi:hypothetical protein
MHGWFGEVFCDITGAVHPHVNPYFVYAIRQLLLFANKAKVLPPIRNAVRRFEPLRRMTMRSTKKVCGVPVYPLSDILGPRGTTILLWISGGLLSLTLLAGCSSKQEEPSVEPLKIIYQTVASAKSDLSTDLDLWQNALTSMISGDILSLTSLGALTISFLLIWLVRRFTGLPLSMKNIAQIMPLIGGILRRVYSQFRKLLQPRG